MGAPEKPHLGGDHVVSEERKSDKNQHDKGSKGRENTFVFLGMQVFSHAAYLKDHVQITMNFRKC